MFTGFTVNTVDLSTIFKVKTTAGGEDTNFIASDGRDLKDWFEISSISGDQIAYDTNYICGAYGDLKNAFVSTNYNPAIFTSTGSHTTIQNGNDYAIQFTGTSGTINFNVNNVTINYLVIGGGGAGMGKSNTISSARRKGGGGASEKDGSFTCLQNTDYTISAGTAGSGGVTFPGSPGNSSSIVNSGQDINVIANGGAGGSGHTGNNDTTYSINYNSIALTYSYGNSGFDSSIPSNNRATRGSGGGVNAGTGSGYNGNGGVGGLVQTFSNNATMSFGNGGGGSGFNNPLFDSGNGGSGSQGVVVLWFTYPIPIIPINYNPWSGSSTSWRFIILNESVPSFTFNSEAKASNTVYFILVGGGGGGASDTSQYTGGGGGGGITTTNSFVGSQLSGTYNIQIGGGGLGGDGERVLDGTDGGNTTITGSSPFVSGITAGGGKGGRAVGNGGAGGTGTYSGGSGGVTITSSRNGENGPVIYFNDGTGSFYIGGGGGGRGGGGPGATGGNGGERGGGAGSGASVGQSGQTFTYKSITYNTGSGGGAGGNNSSFQSSPGGAGNAGLVIIYYNTL